jgi:hypothetical protein
MKAGKNSATAVPPLASEKAVAYKRRGSGRKGPELLATSSDHRNEVCWRHSSRLALKTSAETVQMRITLGKTPSATSSVKPDVCERTGYCIKGNCMLPACSRSPVLLLSSRRWTCEHNGGHFDHQTYSARPSLLSAKLKQ